MLKNVFFILSKISESCIKTDHAIIITIHFQPYSVYNICRDMHRKYTFLYKTQQRAETLVIKASSAKMHDLQLLICHMSF